MSKTNEINTQTLYQLTERGLEIEKMLEDAIDWETGEVKEDYDHAISLREALQTELQDKSKNLIYVIRKNEKLEESIDEEIKRLQTYKKVQRKRSEALKNYIKSCMLTLGIKSIETPSGKLSVQNNPKSVEIYDEKLLDKKFIVRKEIIEENISKTLIKEAIENGEEVQGARLNQGTRLVVK